MDLHSFQRALIALLLVFSLPGVLPADQVIMKDGTVYKGKIMIDTDKALLIGNPPYDPTSYLLESQDIAKIIYEQYVPLPPAERKRGFMAETRLSGNFFSSSDIDLKPAPDLYLGAGFRVHPFFELEAGLDWLPAVGSDGLQITVEPTKVSRSYEHFWGYSGQVGGRFYPFFKKPWKTEPYATVGYGWSRLIPNASGDSLHGAGWHIGVGAQRPIQKHLFLDARFTYEETNYDNIHFLGQEGSIDPSIKERRFGLSLGLAFRL